VVIGWGLGRRCFEYGLPANALSWTKVQICQPALESKGGLRRILAFDISIHRHP
jgi:hypothetical protein